MMQFQQKVAELRSYESITYTICLKIVVDEPASCEAAQKVLIRLFQDNDFWNTDEARRQHYIMRQCLYVCLNQSREVAQLASTSNVS
ncbi:hypothetical protein [Paenibacillus sp. L3-i20]|uniref:hypothetical protein n=1 Tax=Paenibacillus sp. L3-i20 TaxID=2905833 RepID=UPI001EDD8909|nr:hypothetical protein [Paenibacillus sp. L3-i20]GKU78797.1 hypothetical protein L3i20_v231940 [Paenibacillus sp. L3-i20]